MTATEINAANDILHQELATAYGPLPLDAAIEIGEALHGLPEVDYVDLDFPVRDQQNYKTLYTSRNLNCMQWLRLIYDGVRSEIKLRYEVI